MFGLAIRTTNAAEANPSTAQIPSLWNRYGMEQWAERLGTLGAVGPTLAVYSHYASDASGPYQLVVGREVNGLSTRVAELTTETIPEGPYLVFSCPGPLPQAVIRGWQAVWECFEQPEAPMRAFTADFEIYADAQPVEIWVAIRSSP